MTNASLQRKNSAGWPCDSVDLADIRYGVKGWISDGEYRLLSTATLNMRRLVTDKFIWWLQREEKGSVDSRTIRRFLAYLATGHKEEGGRFENPGKPYQERKLRPSSIKTYYDYLAVFMNFLVEEGVVDASPMASLKPTRVPSDQSQPFTDAQVTQLLAAAKQSHYPQA